MTDPKIMCTQHLLGEHAETHMFVGTINKGISIRGYVEGNLCEPSSIRERHDELAEEMVRRGYNHNSPLREIEIELDPGFSDARIDKAAALEELLHRCDACRERSMNETTTDKRGASSYRWHT